MKSKLYNVNIPVTSDLKRRLAVTAEKYDLSMTEMVRDLLENILPDDPTLPPDDFIAKSTIETLLKNHAPIRTTIPYVSSVLGLRFLDGYVIDKDGNKLKVENFPEKGLLHIIYMFNQIYRAYKRIT